MHHMNSGALRSAWQLCSLSLRLIGFLVFCCRGVKPARRFDALFSHLREALASAAKRKFRWRKTGSRVYPMKVLGGGQMLAEQVRWDKTGCLRLCDLANDQADVERS